MTLIEGKITGVLPLARVKSKLFSDALISSPFTVYGGALASNASDMELLIREAKHLAQSLKTDYLELRQQENHYEQGGAQSLYVSFGKAIESCPDKNLKNIPRKQRAMVRKALNQELTYEVNQEVKPFYRLYSESLRNLGTPVQSIHYYQHLLRHFKDCSDVLTVYQGKTPLCSVLSFYYKDQVLPYYGGGGALARHTSANDFMYWSLMNHAQSKGCTYFDFGRSKIDTGSYRFKKHWGFEPKPLHYKVIPVMQQTPPSINPSNPKYQRKIALWKKLPLVIANQLGPMVARRIG